MPDRVSSYPGLPGPPPGWAPAWPSTSRRSPSAQGWIIGGALAAVIAVLVVAVVVLVAVNSGSSTSSDRPGPPPEREEEPVGWDRPSAGATTGVATDGEAACATGGRELFCVDAATGDDQFSERLPGPGTPPVLVDDVVVVAADDPGGDVRGYSLDGDLLWETPEVNDVDLESAELGVASPPPVAGGVVAVSEGDPGDRNTQLVGIDAASGEEAWRAAADSLSSIGWPVSDGERFYGTSPSFTMEASVETTWALVAIDGATGAEAWRFDLGPDPVVVDTAVPVAGGEAVAMRLGGETDRVVVVDAASGELRWEALLTASQASVAHVDGVTVVVDGTMMRGFDDDGAELWSVAAPGAGDPSDESAGVPDLVALDGHLFAHRLDVFEVDPADGRSRLLQDRILVDDLAVAADHLIVAGEGLHGFLLPD